MRCSEALFQNPRKSTPRGRRKSTSQEVLACVHRDYIHRNMFWDHIPLLCPSTFCQEASADAIAEVGHSRADTVDPTSVNINMRRRSIRLLFGRPLQDLSWLIASWIHLDCICTFDSPCRPRDLILHWNSMLFSKERGLIWAEQGTRKALLFSGALAARDHLGAALGGGCSIRPFPFLKSCSCLLPTPATPW